MTGAAGPTIERIAHESNVAKQACAVVSQHTKLKLYRRAQARAGRHLPTMDAPAVNCSTCYGAVEPHRPGLHRLCARCNRQHFRPGGRDSKSRKKGTRTNPRQSSAGHRGGFSPSAGGGQSLAISLVLEGHFHLSSISLDLAVLKLHIQLGYLSHP